VNYLKRDKTVKKPMFEVQKAHLKSLKTALGHAKALLREKSAHTERN
jgi:hypothetical protein